MIGRWRGGLPVGWLGAGLAVSLALFGILAVQITHDSMTESFSSFELQMAEEDARRIKGAFEQAVSQLHDKSVDWSRWDDSYRFVKDRNQAFIKSNLNDDTLVGLRLDLLMYLRNDGSLVYSQAHSGGSDGPLEPQEVLDAIQLPAQTARERVADWSGVVSSPHGPMIVSLRPITDSLGKKPFDGWIVFARVARDLVEQQLSKTVRTKVRIVPPESLEGREAARLSGQSGAFVLSRDDEFVQLAALAGNNEGMPTAVLLAETPRVITQHGSRVTQKAIGGLVKVGASFGLVIAILLLILEMARREIQRKGEALLSHAVILEKEVEERTKRMEHQAFHDLLTGLANRALFMDRLMAWLAGSREERGTGLIFIDLDNFKLVNDSLGHSLGDELLKEVARRILEVAGDRSLVARLGGDEFTVLVPEVTWGEEIMGIAKDILESLRAPVDLGGREAFASASIGVALSFDPELDPQELVRMADTAMYRSKQTGKAMATLFSPSMNQDYLDQLELETSLRRAVEEGAIEVHYQPLVETLTGLTVGAEALARWTHPTRGPIPPSVFIPIAEQTALIGRIGMIVLEKACRQTAAWRKSLGGDGFFVSVNVSSRQLMDDTIVYQVVRALRETGLPGPALHLEITESMLLHESPAVKAKLEDLRSLGIELALDDFGTGYSTLACLRSFPIDTIKIDRSFICKLDVEESAEAMVEAICAVARTMGMRIVGEGIETASQMDRIASIGCDLVQGYYYSRPLPAGEFAERLAADRAA